MSRQWRRRELAPSRPCLARLPLARAVSPSLSILPSTVLSSNRINLTPSVCLYTRASLSPALVSVLLIANAKTRCRADLKRVGWQCVGDGVRYSGHPAKAFCLRGLGSVNARPRPCSTDRVALGHLARLSSTLSSSLLPELDE